MNGHELKDSLLRDAAEMQRERGIMPDSKADDTEWTSQLNEFEQRQAQAKPAPIKKPLETGARAKASALIADSGARVLTQAEVIAAEQARAKKAMNTKLTFDAIMAKRRLGLLMTKPDWALKVKKAWCDGYDFARKNGLNVQMIQGSYVGAVLDESSALFGEWDKIPDRKIIVGGK